MRRPKGKIRDPKLASRVRRKLSIRKKIQGSAERPRLAISKSNKNLRMQAIDDDQGVTLFSVETFGKKRVEQAKKNKEGAKLLGLNLGQKLVEKGVKSAVFDRNGHKYHGVVSALADGVREAGIKF